MLRLIKNEFCKLKFPVTLAVALLSAAAIILSCTLYKGYNLFFNLDAWEVGVEILNFLFPLFVAIPICWNMYYERKNNFLLYTIPRVGQAKYLATKWIAAAISAFAIIFIPYCLSAVFALYVKPPITPWVGEFQHIYVDAYVNTPILYALLLSLWKSVIGVLVTSLGFMLSLYVKNIFVILTGPFIYTILENFLFSIFGKPEYRLITSFEPTVMSEERMTRLSFAVGPAVLVLFIIITWVILAKVKRKTVYEV